MLRVISGIYLFLDIIFSPFFENLPLQIESLVSKTNMS